MSPNDTDADTDANEGGLEGVDDHLENAPFERCLYEAASEGDSRPVEKVAIGFDYDETLVERFGELDWDTCHHTWEPEYRFAADVQRNETGAWLVDADASALEHVRRTTGINVPEAADLEYNSAPVPFEYDDPLEPPAGGDDTETEAEAETDAEQSSLIDHSKPERSPLVERVEQAEFPGGPRPSRTPSESTRTPTRPRTRERVGTGPINKPLHRLDPNPRDSPSECPLCGRGGALVSELELERGVYPNRTPIMDMTVAGAADVCCVKCDSLFVLDLEGEEGGDQHE